jgi:hypothetical protein
VFEGVVDAAVRSALREGEGEKSETDEEVDASALRVRVGGGERVRLLVRLLSSEGLASVAVCERLS